MAPSTAHASALALPRGIELTNELEITLTTAHSSALGVELTNELLEMAQTTAHSSALTVYRGVAVEAN